MTSESSPTPRFRLGRRALLGGAVALGTGTVFGLGELALTGPASAGSVPTPDIASCADWKARPPSQPVTVLHNKPNKIIVHHTAMDNSTDYSKEHAFANARAIQNLHMDKNGWLDSGQQFTNSRGGFVTEGRHGSLDALRGGTTMIEGAQTVGQNDQSIGIENEGTYLTVQPPEALWNQLVNLCAYICHQYGIPAKEIYGHKDFNNTQCPGLLHDRLPELRTAVGKIIG